MISILPCIFSANMVLSLAKPYSRVEIYGQLKGLINEVNTANHLTRYLDDDRWDDLEYELGEKLLQVHSTNLLLP